MSQQYPPGDGNPQWNNPQQYPSGNSNPQWNNPQQYPSGDGNPQWNNPQPPYNPGQPPYNPQQPYYPQQPPMYQQPPKKRLLWPWFVGGGCLVLILAICGILVVVSRFATTAVNNTVSNSSLPNAAATVQSAVQTDETPVSTSAHHKLNETVSVGNTWQVTVTKVSTSQGDDIDTPAAGNTFIQIDISMKNISNQQQIASSLIQYSLSDTSGQKYNENLMSGTPGPEGKVAAGAPLKGSITYEVPKSTKSFVLSFSPDFSGQLVTWDISL